MKKDLSDKILQTFPELFPDNQCVFDCGDGWFQVIWNMCVSLQAIHEAYPEFKIHHMKEKYACLQVHDFPHYDVMNSIVLQAECFSVNICEICGNDGKDVRAIEHHGWERTLCNKCSWKVRHGWKSGQNEKFSTEQEQLVQDLLMALNKQVEKIRQEHFPNGKLKIVLTDERPRVFIRDGKKFFCI